VLSIKPVAEILVVWIKQTDTTVSVVLIRGSKQNDFECLYNFLQELLEVRPESDEDVEFFSMNGLG